VTASVDRLDLLAPLTADANYRLSGHVIYVGSSSMEVFVSIEQLTPPTQPNKICLTGRFTMAARNAHTLRSQRIAPLILETDAEKALFAMGESHKNRKRAEAASSLEKVPPSKEEAFLLHSQYIRGLHAGMFANTDELHGPTLKADPVTSADGSTLVPVRRTSMSTTMHMHPQQRNVHQKIFGGFLMRSAYELAWMVSGKMRPHPFPSNFDRLVTNACSAWPLLQHRWSTVTCSSFRSMHSRSTLPCPSVRCCSSRLRSYTPRNQSSIHTATPSPASPCSPKSSTSKRANAKRATPYVSPHRPLESLLPLR
jgi:acyl-CoA hydrolase